MWTDKDYNDLLTFAEFVDEHGSNALYDGTKLEDDDVTQDAILEWFFYRKVTDNNRFLKYFRRALNVYENQYYNLLRIETTDIDPLVSNYLERQILRRGTGTTTDSNNLTVSGTTSGRSTTTGTGTGGSTTTTRGTGTNTGTTDTTTTDSGTTSGTTSNNMKHKHGETPQAASSTGGGMALDWSYLSNQDEEENTGTNSGTSSGTSRTQGTTGDTSTTEGTATTTSTDTSNAETVTTGNNGRTETGTNTRTDNSADDTRERLTGRQEAPQDLLSRARDYITRTNAFLWLSERLEDCFLQIFEY